MKKLLLFVTLTLTALPAEAGPKHWLKTHKRFLAVESAAVAAASIHAAGLHYCRKTNGVEPCDAHYGAAWANFGIVTALNVVVLPSAAEGCWKNEGGKWCNLLAYGGSASQAGWGVHEWRIRAKEIVLH